MLIPSSDKYNLSGVAMAIHIQERGTSSKTQPMQEICHKIYDQVKSFMTFNSL